MYWMKRIHGGNSDEYKSIIPDTTVWSNDTKHPLEEFYLDHPAYQSYPLVEITYRQAVKYCKWRSDRVNEVIYIKENKLKVLPDKPYTNFPEIYKYRLPTKEEWEMLASVGMYEKTKKKAEKKLKGLQLYNFKNDESRKLDTVRPGDIVEIEFTWIVHGGWPNKYGLYLQLNT